MADLTPASFRITEEDKEKFKSITKEFGFGNQSEAFTELINTWEMSQAKKSFNGDRAKEIEVFQTTLSKLGSIFLNTLEFNESSEERIRDEVTLELTTKDRVISNLQDQLEKIKINNSELEKNFKEKSTELNQAKETIIDLSNNIDKLKKDLDDKQKTIDILNKSNVNQLEQLEQYKDLKSINDLLLKQLEELESKTVSLETTNKQLSDKVNNSEDMISFYKENIADLKRDVEAYKEDLKDLDIKHSKYIEELEIKHIKQLDEIKSNYEKSIEKEKVISDQYRDELTILDQKYNDQIKEIKTEHKRISENEINLIKEQLVEKYNLQLDKKDLQIEKFKNEIEQIKSKFSSRKTSKQERE
ncbi:hypothetical protein GKZ28_08530 [Clostridium chromiireducens]|jgi:hypothetical protein|uniref:Uncharacterized protein n=1 Tax=Clostridium chromiireducens TaxID=225345 RepID=A0A964RLH3_9CLOT|nr:hypothetical protein [Clostridium chromiireducens]MVX63740.1 hypothetical protein [Clostridium chromiireducens]